LTKRYRLFAFLVIGMVAVVTIAYILHDERQDDVVVVPNTTVNGHRTSLILDTGSTSVILWRSSAKRLGLKPLMPSSAKENDPAADPNRKEEWFCAPARVTAGREAVGGPLVVMDATGFDGDGLVGWPEVRDDLLVFDPRQRTVRVAKALPPEVAHWLKLKVRWAGQLFLEIPLPTGRTGVLLVDTGAATGVSLSPESWSPWRQRHPQAKITARDYRNLSGGQWTSQFAWADRVSIGPLTLTDVEVAEASGEEKDGMPKDYAGTLGLEALARMDFVVDGKNGFAYARPRPAGPTSARHGDWTVAGSLPLHGDSLLVDGAGVRLDLEDYAGAVAEINRALALNSNNPEAWELRGLVRERTRDYAGAVADTSRALQLNTNFPGAWLTRGEARADEEDWDGAIRDFNQALVLDPESASAYHDRGEAREAKNDWNGALADLNRALQLDPGSVDSWLSLGAARQNHGDFSGAREVFEQGCRLNSEDTTYADLYNELLLLRAGGSAVPFATSIAGWKDGWVKHVARFLAGQIDERALLAAAEKKDVETVSGQRCEAYYFIGMMRLIRGDRAGARDYLQRCVGTGEKEYYEYSFARAELGRLNAPPTKARR
jgi:tetratricopeptide (TPR) repeat protein